MCSSSLHTPLCKKDCVVRHHDLVLSLCLDRNSKNLTPGPQRVELRESIKEHIEKGWKCDSEVPDECEKLRYPLIYLAAAFGKSSSLASLLQLGLKPSTRSRDGETALHGAVKHIRLDRWESKHAHSRFARVVSKLTKAEPRLILATNSLNHQTVFQAVLERLFSCVKQKEMDIHVSCTSINYKVRTPGLGETTQTILQGFFQTLIDKTLDLIQEGKLIDEEVVKVLGAADSQGNTIFHTLASHRKHGPTCDMYANTVERLSRFDLTMKKFVSDLTQLKKNKEGKSPGQLANAFAVSDVQEPPLSSNSKHLGGDFSRTYGSTLPELNSESEKDGTAFSSGITDPSGPGPGVNITASSDSAAFEFSPPSKLEVFSEFWPAVPTPKSPAGPDSDEGNSPTTPKPETPDHTMAPYTILLSTPPDKCSFAPDTRPSVMYKTKSHPSPLSPSNCHILQTTSLPRQIQEVQKPDPKRASGNWSTGDVLESGLETFKSETPNLKRSLEAERSLSSSQDAELLHLMTADVAELDSEGKDELLGVFQRQFQRKRSRIDRNISVMDNEIELVLEQLEEKTKLAIEMEQSLTDMKRDIVKRKKDLFQKEEQRRELCVKELQLTKKIALCLETKKQIEQLSNREG